MRIPAAHFRGFDVPDKTAGTGQSHVFSGHFGHGVQSQLAPGRKATIAGLPHTGMAPIRRKQYTDFGSPWQGLNAESAERLVRRLDKAPKYAVEATALLFGGTALARGAFKHHEDHEDTITSKFEKLEVAAATYHSYEYIKEAKHAVSATLRQADAARTGIILPKAEAEADHFVHLMENFTEGQIKGGLAAAGGAVLWQMATMHRRQKRRSEGNAQVSGLAQAQVTGSRRHASI